MPSFNLVHFQNPAPERESGYAAWQRVTLSPRLLRVPGVKALQFMAIQAVQLQPLAVQPWRFCTLLEFEAADSAQVLAAFGQHARSAATQEGLLAVDAAHLFELTRPHLPSLVPETIDESAPLHLAFVMGNCIEGKEVEYDRWYDELHSVEVLGTPHFASMRRGVIASAQAEPANEQPANRLVLLSIRTRDLHASIEEFIARAHGTSASGIKWAPRESAAAFASLKRTTHVFTPFSPRLTA